MLFSGRFNGVQMKMALLSSITLAVLMGCASSQKTMVKQVVGREVDEFEYTPFSRLDDELKNKKLDEIEYKTERALIPKGGRLYLLDKKHYVSDPIVSVVASDGKRTFKCDDSEVSRTVVAPTGYTPEALILKSLGVSYDKSKTEIDCEITLDLKTPITFHMVSTNNDTVSRYQYVK